jgi:uncharacterized protein YecT (DUF1311 family)
MRLGRSEVWAAAVVLGGLWGAGTAAAQSNDCADAMSQVDLNACAAEDLAWADEDLNAAYAGARAAMRSLDADQSEDTSDAEDALRAAQRAWIAFRDLACAAEGYTVAGGSIEPMVVLMCMTRLTETRAEDLRLFSGEVIE